MPRVATPLALAFLALVITAAPASAGMITFGSLLSAVADVTESDPEDSAFWNESLGGQADSRQAGGRSAAVAMDGQVTLIRLKGTVTPHSDPTAPAPLNEVHFQTLEPLGDGTVKVRLSSAAFTVPVGGDPNTITEYRPENLCALKGDFVAFNDEGGFDPTYYPNGVPFQVFGSVPGSRLARFTKHNSTNSGQILTPTTTDGRELLMQVVLAYGPDASSACGGRPLQAGPCANKATGDGSLVGTVAGDTLMGGSLDDVLQGLAGDDCLYGQGGSDQLDGGDGLDKLFGGIGNDALTGGTGNDYLTGESGNDVLIGGAGNDRFSGGSGNDNASAGSGRDNITGSSGRDRLSGGMGNDRLSGGASLDQLKGGSGNDRISGGSGADTITGGTGRDSITGSSGNDGISVRDGSRDRVNCGSGRDRVTADRRDSIASNCERVARH